MKKTVLVLMLAALCLMLCSCTTIGYVYPDHEDYTAGDASISDRVEDLEIGWINGSVNVAYHEGDKILLSESSNRTLSTDLKLHWMLDGDKLVVKYAASGLQGMHKLGKQLTVLLPKDLHLEEVEINVASAEVEADGLNADEIHIRTASGRVALRQSGHAEEIRVDTASGGVAVAAEKAELVHINTASGDVIVDGWQVERAEGITASGKMVMQFANAPEKIDLKAVSGDITLRLPHGAGFVADADSISGKVLCDLPAKNRGDDRYEYGNGDCRIEVGTVSGDIRLEENMNAGQEI